MRFVVGALVETGIVLNNLRGVDAEVAIEVDEIDFLTTKDSS